MSIFLLNPLNVICDACGAREGDYCLEGSGIKGGFHPIRSSEIDEIVNQGVYSENSNLSKLAHYIYQGESKPNFKKCLMEAWEVLNNNSRDKVEILMVLIDEGFTGSKDELFKVIKFL